MDNFTMFETVRQELGYDIGERLRPVEIARKQPENPESLSSVSEWLALEKAGRLGAHYVYFRRFADRPSQPMFYVYDYTEEMGLPDEKELGRIQKDIWSSAETPCAFLFSKDSVSIIDTSEAPRYVGDNIFTPTYLLEKAGAITDNIRERFSAYQLLTGEFWNTEAEFGNFKFDKSAHKTLLDKLRAVREAFLKEDKELAKPVNRLLIQCVLVRYLEEKSDVDKNGDQRTVFPKDFFTNLCGGEDFKHALITGRFWEVFAYLNQQDHLNGRIFEWSPEEKAQLNAIPVKRLVSLLYDTRSNGNEQLALWDLYSFRYLPVEIVSSIYEALFRTEGSVKKDGMVYTPPHLAAFLIDEAMPLNAWSNKEDFKILDPSCGSGVFLVLAFKRLVHWWRLRNNGIAPERDELIRILSHSIHGVDLHENAILLTRFSLCLAVCDQLAPPEIWDALRFPDLEGKLVNSDFFDWHREHSGKESFDLVIGNPPFVTNHKSLPHWKEVSDFKVPQKQIVLYFLAASRNMVKPDGLLCLLVKSSSFLYTTTGGEFRRRFLLQNQVHQVLDFTLLARNNVLWNTDEPDTAAIFATPGMADTSKKILHLVVRRSSATRSKKFFELDAYDFNWVPYVVALKDAFVWKTNLLGGGRLYGAIRHLKTFPTLKDHFDKSGWLYGEGYIMSQRKAKVPSEFITNKPTLPIEWLTEEGVFSEEFPNQAALNFYYAGKKEAYEPPHFLIKESVGDNNSIPVYYSNQYLTFPSEVIGVSAKGFDVHELFDFSRLFVSNNSLYRAVLFATSTKCLIYRNTSVLASDIYSLPYGTDLVSNKLEGLALNDVIKYYQDFIRHPDTSKAFQEIHKTHLTQFSSIFCEALNTIYTKNNLRFRQAETGTLHFGKYIYAAFCYDDQPDHAPSPFGELTEAAGLENLTTLDKGYARFNRIQKIYKKDYVCFIKPNQFRYWLDSIALRDADWVLADLVAQGH